MGFFEIYTCNYFKFGCKNLTKVIIEKEDIIQKYY